MYQQDTVRRERRFHIFHVAIVGLIACLFMSAAPLHAASVDAVDTSKDQAVHGWWEFVYGAMAAGCSVTNEGLHVARTTESAALEAATGQTSIEKTLVDFIEGLPFASNGLVVRFEGGIPDQETVAALASKGYSVANSVPPSEGFEVAVEYGE